eukprot:gene13246-biopygen8636
MKKRRPDTVAEPFAIPLDKFPQVTRSEKISSDPEDQSRIVAQKRPNVRNCCNTHGTPAVAPRMISPRRLQHQVVTTGKSTSEHSACHFSQLPLHMFHLPLFTFKVRSQGPSPSSTLHRSMTWELALLVGKPSRQGLGKPGFDFPACPTRLGKPSFSGERWESFPGKPRKLARLAGQAGLGKPPAKQHSLPRGDAVPTPSPPAAPPPAAAAAPAAVGRTSARSTAHSTLHRMRSGMSSKGGNGVCQPECWGNGVCCTGPSNGMPDGRMGTHTPPTAAPRLDIPYKPGARSRSRARPVTSATERRAIVARLESSKLNNGTEDHVMQTDMSGGVGTFDKLLIGLTMLTKAATSCDEFVDDKECDGSWTELNGCTTGAECLEKCKEGTPGESFTCCDWRRGKQKCRGSTATTRKTDTSWKAAFLCPNTITPTRQPTASPIPCDGFVHSQQGYNCAQLRPERFTC